MARASSPVTTCMVAISLEQDLVGGSGPDLDQKVGAFMLDSLGSKRDGETALGKATRFGEDGGRATRDLDWVIYYTNLVID